MHCDVCKDDFQEVYKCDICRKNNCKQCGSVSSSEVKVLQLRNRVLKFFCPVCIQSDVNVPLQNIIQEKSDIIANKEKTITLLEQEIANMKISLGKNLVNVSPDETKTEDIRGMLAGITSLFNENVHKKEELQTAAVTQKENECIKRELATLGKLVAEQEYTINLQKERLDDLKSGCVGNQSFFSNTRPPASYSAVTQNKFIVNKTKQSHALFVQSRDANISSADAMKELKSKLNPVEHNLCIQNTKITRNGVMFNCENKENLNKLRDKLSSEVGAHYHIHEGRKVNPRIKIQKIENEFASSENFLTSLIEQNNLNSDLLDIKLIGKHGRGPEIDVVVEVTAALRKLIIDRGFLFAGWRKCTVSDYYPILRCFKCCRYHHAKDDCKNEQTCPFCAGRHSSRDCNLRSAKKCVNCLEYNTQHKANGRVDHSVTDPSCRVYRQIVQNIIAKTQYEP